MDDLTWLQSIYDSIKSIAPLVAAVFTGLIWRDQRKHQERQNKINSELQRELAELGKNNSLEIQKKEFELKHFELLTQKRIEEYAKFLGLISDFKYQLLLGNKTILEIFIDLAAKIQDTPDMIAMLDNKTQTAWGRLMNRVLNTTNGLRKDLENDKEATHLLLVELDLMARKDIIELHDFESLHKDTVENLQWHVAALEKLGIQPLSSLHQQGNNEEIHTHTAQPTEKQPEQTDNTELNENP